MKTRAGFWLAAAVVLVSNGAALRHAAANRSSAEAEVVLTERELFKETLEPDNTGVSLRLNWGSLYGLKLEDWLNRAKLKELGFDVTADPGSPAARLYYYSMPSRPAWVALENDGPAWPKYLSDLEASMKLSNVPYAARQLEQSRNSSRLIPIDAGTALAELRARHPDASRILIVGATVRVSFTGKNGQILTGNLQPVATRLHVPLPFSRQLNEIPSAAYGTPAPSPRYQIHLRFGTHREPWVVNVERLN